MPRLEAELVLAQLSKLLESRPADKLGDEELLERFAVLHDEEAFAAGQHGSIRELQFGLVEELAAGGSVAVG